LYRSPLCYTCTIKYTFNIISPTLREEQSLRVLDIRELRRIFGPKRDVDKIRGDEMSW
jgi:hypothetical protein